MALIGKIRKNSWLLIVLIGLGLGGFLLMDMFNNQTGLTAGNRFTMGSVNGEKINYNEFTATENALYANGGGETYARRDFLWNYFVENTLVSKEAEKLGLGVSSQELRDLQFGPNFSPIIQTRFLQSNPQQGQQQLQQIQADLDAGDLGTKPYARFWSYQQKEIIKERLQSKLTNLVSKSIYSPSWLVEYNYEQQNDKLDLAYVRIPFDEIDNSEVSLSDEDYRTYINNRKGQFVSDEETRKVAYTVFNVLPTGADSAAIYKRVAADLQPFAEAENDTLFVENRYGVIDAIYETKDKLSASIADTMVVAQPGTVVGPYLEDGGYKLAKLIDRKIIPDSVKARHILLRAGSKAPEALFSTIDSLKNLIESGVATFDTLASQFGSDATASKGGDLGYAAPGTMVKPFNDLIFFEAEEGKLYSIATQFGVHLVEVTGKKFLNDNVGMRIAYVRESIVPSEQTQKAFNEKAIEFASQNNTLEKMRAAVESDPDLEIEYTKALEENDFNIGQLGGGEESRSIVKWAFSSDTRSDEVSPDVYVYQDPVEYYEAKYVIAALQNIQPAGKIDYDGLKDEIQAQVRNQKKGEMIAKNITSSNLSALASQYSSAIDTARSVAFSNTSIPGMGNEAKVLAKAATTEAGQVSEAIVGENGVYVVKVLNKVEAAPNAPVPSLRSLQMSSNRSQVPFRLMEAMKADASIKDYRSKFY